MLLVFSVSFIQALVACVKGLLDLKDGWVRLLFGREWQIIILDHIGFELSHHFLAGLAETKARLSCG